MITFTIPSFILILLIIATAGAAVGIWSTLNYTAPKHPDETVK